MKKFLLPVFCVLLATNFLSAQKYFSKTGSIYFLSVAPMEKIESRNGNAYVIFDSGTGQMEWSVLIKGFKFEKALMQEHFNENYMESDQFPKGTFKGKIVNMSGVNCTKDGVYNVEVSGNLTLHGVTKPLTVPGKIIVKNGIVNASSTFELTVADYGIEVPKVVRENIAKTVKVTVNADLQRMEK